MTKPIQKPNPCKCIFAKNAFFDGKQYYYNKLDRGTFRVYYDYANNKSRDDYEVMDTRNFYSRFKVVR